MLTNSILDEKNSRNNLFCGISYSYIWLMCCSRKHPYPSHGVWMWPETVTRNNPCKSYPYCSSKKLYEVNFNFFRALNAAEPLRYMIQTSRHSKIKRESWMHCLQIGEICFDQLRVLKIFINKVAKKSKSNSVQTHYLRFYRYIYIWVNICIFWALMIVVSTLGATTTKIKITNRDPWWKY